MSSEDLKQRIREYYIESSLDYHAWSPAYNMHFGYFRWGMNPLRRESLLEEMNRQVAQRLCIAPNDRLKIIDLGCGLGAPARRLGRNFPNCHVTAITLVPWQAGMARDLTHAGNVTFQTADYTQLPFADGEFDRALAIESSCHDKGDSKVDFIREAARSLRPGGRLVVADGFRKQSTPLPPGLRNIFDVVCRNWAVDSFAVLPQFLDEMKSSGFVDMCVEEISWNIAPSVMHIPWVTTKFLLIELFKHGLRLSPARRGHLLACLLSPLVGIARWHFGYYLISASKG